MMRSPDIRQLTLPFFRKQPPAERATPAVEAPRRTPPDPEGPEALEAHRMRIAGYLTMQLPDPVVLTFTNNRSTMISFRKQRGRYSVRLHRMFRHADSDTLDQLVGFLTRKSKSAADAIDAFIATHRQEIDRSRRRRTQTPISAGRHINLAEVLERVSLHYFGGPQEVRIGWGAAPRRRRRSRRYGTFSRALATYHYEERLIRVSPVLDAPDVPDYVIDWIIYHELLHHVLPVMKSGSRNIYHSAKFRALERGFEHFEKAKAWEKTHLARLLK